MNDRQRKDRLIQTRVPQNLESTLKDEARKRRLSVSHLIRNVLEDTFNLVDNVVLEVDRVVTDSVEMAQTLRRDAQRLAATARGETAHRTESNRAASREQTDDAPAEAGPGGEVALAPEPDFEVVEGEHGAAVAVAEPAEMGLLSTDPLAHVYAFRELVLNRRATCARCEGVIERGSRAYLGLSDDTERPRTWLCAECLETVSEPED